MNQGTKDYIKTRMQEIKSMCNKLDYEAKILDIEETAIPTILISISKSSNGDDIVVTCNIIPMQIENVSAVFLQFYICVSPSIPEKLKSYMDEFIRRQNEHFMIGNLMKFENCICLKNALYIDASREMHEDEFARALDIFIYQASIMADKVSSITKKEKSIDEVINQGSMFI